MALTYGSTAADRVLCGTNFGLLAQETVICWAYPTSLIDSRRFWARDASFVHNMGLTGTSGNINYARRRSTGGANNTTYTSSSTPLSTLNKWYCVAGTFTDSGTTPAVHLYVGDLTTTMAEVTYGTTTDGSGAVQDESAETPAVGNDNVAGPVRCFSGSIGFIHVIAGVLTLSQIQAQQYRPFRDANSKLLMALGIGNIGVGTQQDWSGAGNNGTCFGSPGASPNLQPPLDMSLIFGQGSPLSCGLVQVGA